MAKENSTIHYAGIEQMGLDHLGVEHQTWLRDISKDRVRITLLGEEFKRLGGKPFYTDAQEKITPYLPLDDLRRIHELSIPFKLNASYTRVGSIGLQQETVDKKGYLSDLLNPHVRLDIDQSERLLRLNFTPFGLRTKEDNDQTEAMFLGAVDLLRVIQEYPKKFSIPKAVVGITNETLSKLAIKQLGFHTNAGIEYSRRLWGEKQRVMEIDDIQKIIYGKKGIQPELKDDTEIYIDIFTPGEEFFNTTMIQRVEKYRDLLCRRIIHERSDDISPEMLIAAESYARSVAITYCIRENPSMAEFFNVMFSYIKSTYHRGF